MGRALPVHRKFGDLKIPRLLPFLALAAVLGSPAYAQQPTVIAVPTFATAKIVETDAGSTWGIANQIADLITADLGSTDAFTVADVKKVRIPSFPEVTAPSYQQWRTVGAKLLLSGFVNARDDGRLTIGCYVYDVQTGRELARQGFAVTTTEWRRAAHRCADAAYQKATGKAPQFDSRIAYVSQSGSGDSLVKRIAIMDFDGANHAFVTEGESTVLTPSLSPKGDRIAYTSFSGGKLHIRIAGVGNKEDRALLPMADENFAPAFSPDGNSIALAMSQGGNVDIFAVPSSGGSPSRLTTSPAIDTGPAFSPDGDRIAFVSDRSGTPQLYVMDSDGSNQHRVSFATGAYGAPAWSPDGSRIAFTRTQGPLSQIGTVGIDGTDERIVTVGPNDEEPSWSPDGSRLLFQRQDPATRRTLLATVPADGGAVRSVATPQAGSDPSWAERGE